ncbi:GyrI-like domain-containing protein [Paenibacillus sp. FSL M7-1046]|uniref:GyrI-like domain-containing protein n=1 Tax=Paenibacillus sp. FSL M7-1046 TaxID=2975315 RepID=UPI0030F8867E
MTEPLRQSSYDGTTEGYAPKFKPRVIELIRQQLEKEAPQRTDSIGGEKPYVLDLPELQVIGWQNLNQAGEPYADIWGHVFGEIDIDSKFDSIPSKVQSSGCYLGIFEGRDSVPKLWEQSAWDTGYFLGVEVGDPGTVPEGLVHKDYPASKYAIFIAKGVPAAAFQSTWDYIHQEWLPSAEFKFNEAGVFFINYTEKSGPDDERFEAHLCVPVVEK